MSRFLVPLGFLLLMGMFWLTLNRIGEGEYDPRNIPTEFIGKAAPLINVPDLFDPTKMVHSADMMGQVWLFNVWGTWCPECMREHEYLLTLSKTVPIIGLNWRDQSDAAQAMLARYGNPFKQVGFDPQSNVAMDWGVYGAPETFLVDAAGVIRAKHAGAMTRQVWEQKFQAYFEKGSSKP